MINSGIMVEAACYVKQDKNAVKCFLCPHSCLINEGDYGKCRVRLNRKGILYSENWGRLTCLSLDPIEKKPLYHFFPGMKILSLGTFGCNFHCIFCQNHNISQSPVEPFLKLDRTSPQYIIEEASASPTNIGIAYTYNEPTVWYEYMLEIASLAVAGNLRNVVVSNGHIRTEPLEKLLDVIHAFNIDFKSFSDSFYRDIAGGSLNAVKKTLKAIKLKEKHLEVTFLLVPGLNDNEGEFRDMVGWISDELGDKTVFHINRYFPAWKLDTPYTPSGLMKRFFGIAREKLKYVYLGNLPPGSPGSDTECAGCGSRVIKRAGYRTDLSGLDDSGNCIFCGEPVTIRI